MYDNRSADLPEPFTNRATGTGTYSVYPDDLPRPISDTSEAVVVTPVRVQAELSCSLTPNYAAVQDTVACVLEVSNRSTLSICNVTLKIPSLSEYLAVSDLRANGVTPPSGHDLHSGVIIPFIAAGGEAQVTFQATVLPGIPDQVEMCAHLAYTCVINENPLTREMHAEPLTLQVVKPGLEIKKRVDKHQVWQDGEVVTYRVMACNNGNHPVENLVVTDSLPKGMSYLPYSTCIGCGEPINANPADGIAVGDLPAHSCLWVQYRVTVAIKPEKEL
ncbi:DUF11 domain-containing protein [Ligaoa zhengdingensis]|uniref:DUF11 domain-containing protein n=1 Tax=Ligaoa zhengdingensis TaxID=2763658 RepID=UPI0031BBB7A8